MGIATTASRDNCQETETNTSKNAGLNQSAANSSELRVQLSTAAVSTNSEVDESSTSESTSHFRAEGFDDIEIKISGKPDEARARERLVDFLQSVVSDLEAEADGNVDTIHIDDDDSDYHRYDDEGDEYELTPIRHNGILFSPPMNCGFEEVNIHVMNAVDVDKAHKHVIDFLEAWSENRTEEPVTDLFDRADRLYRRFDQFIWAMMPDELLSVLASADSVGSDATYLEQTSANMIRAKVKERQEYDSIRDGRKNVLELPHATIGNGCGFSPGLYVRRLKDALTAFESLQATDRLMPTDSKLPKSPHSDWIDCVVERLTKRLGKWEQFAADTKGGAA